jgi:mono/diheme cytochrome c family protein
MLLVLLQVLATYRDRTHEVRQVVPAPQFYLEPNESIHPSLEPAFEAEWTGQLSVLQAGSYTFRAGEASITVDGRPVTGPVSLTAGRHPITIRYRRKPGVAQLRLRWESDRFGLEPIPSSAFYSEETVNDPAEQGRGLVEELGCVNCHRTASPSLQGRPGPDLAGLGSRVDARWLYRWLEDPAAFRSGSVMPALADEQQRRDITAYLASLGGAVTKPRRISAGDVAAGIRLFGQVGCAACHQQEGLALEGLGSKTTAGPLAEFLKNPGRSDPSGRMPSLLLTDQEAHQLAAFLVDSRNSAFERPVPPGDPVRGKALVQSSGCLACHALPDVPNTQEAPPLDKLAAGRGCLALSPSPAVPRYRLTGAQRQAIEAFLAAWVRHPDVSPAPVHRFYRSLEQLRCTACHALDRMRPSVQLAEGAPALTDAGAKLRTSWIDAVLTRRERIQPWLALRMPDYDPRHAGPLAGAFAQAAGREPGDGPPAPAVTEAHRTRGAGMLGTNPQNGGLACIGCHDWGKYKSLGEEAPQLINAASRLRYDWYTRWMRDPARILSGTSMPNYFGTMDRARGADAILSLWAALSLGDKLPVPDGLEQGKAAMDAEALPVPVREPIVIRWDMPEATPAAIAVGLPGGVSYCFDAGESRLRYAWLGGFLDLSATLTRKTDANRLTPTAKIAGEIFYRSDGFPWQAGAPDRIPQARFRGYRLNGGFPEFHYQVDGIDVYERLVPASDRRGLTRELTVWRVDGPMWFQGKPVERGTNVRFEVTVRP